MLVQNDEQLGQPITGNAGWKGYIGLEIFWKGTWMFIGDLGLLKFDVVILFVLVA